MNPTHSAISVVIGLAFSVPAVAQENQLPTEAFLGSPSDGRVVMDTYGNCVRTSQWNLDRNIVGCGRGILICQRHHRNPFIRKHDAFRNESRYFATM